jgi:hypothetical protein
VFQAGLGVLAGGGGVSQDALERGSGCIVSLADLRARPDFREEFLLWCEVVGQQSLERPDPIQQLQLAGSVVAVVADGLADDVPVLLFDVGTVVLVT